MAFDRIAAKDEGYTDAEIDAYLATGQEPDAAPAAAAEGRASPEFAYTGAPDEPLEEAFNPLDLLMGSPFAGPVTRTASAIPGAVRGVGAGFNALRQSPTLGPTLGRLGLKFAARQVPILGPAIDMFDLGRGVMAAGKAAAPAARAATRTAGKTATEGAGKIAGRIKPHRPPKPRVKAKEARVKAKETPAGNASARVRKSQAMRGASRPELERRTDARAQATGQQPPAEFDDLAAQLEQSLLLEEQMQLQGLDEAQKQAMRFLARQQGGLP